MSVPSSPAILKIVYPVWGNGYVEYTQGTHEFFTGEEEPTNRTFADLVNAINNCAICSFVHASNVRAIEMGNIIYVFCKEVTDPSEELVENPQFSIPIEFQFTNASPVTINYPINPELVRGFPTTEKISRLVEETLGKCKIIGQTLSFSSGTETIIANRRCLTTIVKQD